MLFEFITMHRDPIIARVRAKVSIRPSPPASTSELENGVPMFLTQLAERLRDVPSGGPPSATTALGSSATRHGRDLLAVGYTVSQVVHGYGDVCQAVTELALEQNAPISTEEFKALNGCLDTAIAEAVTEHARLTAEARTADELARGGQLVHEIRNMLNTAILAFDVVKRGTVGVNGTTGAVLGRSLMRLRDLVEVTLTDTRTAASHQRPEQVLLTHFLQEIGTAARLQAENSRMQFIIEPVDPELAAMIDGQLLASAVMNLLNNAFKYTPPAGRVVLRAGERGERVFIEVEDECGGLAQRQGDPFQAFGERSAKDRTGLGLGLSIARKAVKAQGGDIHTRNMPGHGCVFVIEVPKAAAGALAPATLPPASPPDA